LHNVEHKRFASLVFIKFIEFNRKFVWAAMGIFHDQQVDGRGNPDPMQKLANVR